MVEGTHFRARLRVRLAKSLNTKDVQRAIKIGTKEVIIKSRMRDQPLEDATWIILQVGGFPTKEEAEDYGNQLKVAVEFAGLCDRLGIDVGSDKATSSFSKDLVQAMEEVSDDVRIQPSDVHGLMVMPMTKGTCF
jgi:hypothetical protein